MDLEVLRFVTSDGTVARSTAGRPGDLLKYEPRREGEWIHFPDLCISRKHAVLTRMDDGRYAIENAESRSGTFVNDLAITGKRTLEIGDSIKIGQTNIEVCDETGREPEIPYESLGSD